MRPGVRQITLAVGAVVAAGVAVRVAYVTFGGDPADSVEAFTKQRLEERDEAARAFEFVRLSGVARNELETRVERAIRQSPTLDELPEDERDHRIADLREEVVGLIDLGLREGASFDDYVEWRRSRGYRLRTAAEHEARYSVTPSEHARLFGIDLPINMAAEAAKLDIGAAIDERRGLERRDAGDGALEKRERIFRALWDGSRAYEDGHSVPDEVPIRGGLAATFGTLRSGAIRMPELSGGGMEFGQWFAGGEYGWQLWMGPPYGIREMLAREHEVEIAVVGISLRYDGADPTNLICKYYWLPEARRWVHFMVGRTGSSQVGKRPPRLLLIL